MPRGVVFVLLMKALSQRERAKANSPIYAFSPARARTPAKSADQRRRILALGKKPEIKTKHRARRTKRDAPVSSGVAPVCQTLWLNLKAKHHRRQTLRPDRRHR